MDGSFLRLSDGHGIAIYLRDGVPYLAEFRHGRSELHTVGTWFALRNRGGALRRLAADPVPIPAEVAERIERLHCAEARAGGPAADFLARVARLADAVPRLLGARRVDKGESSCRSFASR